MEGEDKYRQKKKHFYNADHDSDEFLESRKTLERKVKKMPIEK